MSTLSRIACWLAPFALAMGAAATALAAPFEVMIVTWRGCEEACQGFQQYFRERGIEARFTVRDAAQRKDALPAIRAEARRSRFDLILLWGTTVTQEIAGTLSQRDTPEFRHDTPQVFMIVADPVGAGIIEDLERTGRSNLTGTFNRVPERVNIETLRTYLPSFKRLGLLYHADEPNSVLKRDELASLARTMKFELLARELPPGPDGKPSAAALDAQIAALKTEGADFLYLGSSSFLQRSGDTVTATAVRNGLPVLSPYEQLVRESSALLSVAPRYGDVGRLAGAQAERILVGGKRAGDLPVARMNEFAVVINMSIARKLRLFPPLPLVQVAETVN